MTILLIKLRNSSVMMKSLLMLFSGFCLFFFISAVFADSVKLTNVSGNTIAADYFQGENNTNPVLLLHGFLQTSDFSTVRRLETFLEESGYTVLNPTLSLGISNRKQSLSCEAVHTHTLDGDADELGQWVKWLYNKTGKKVTLIGHSSGGSVLLKYMEDSDAKYVNHVILVSMAYYAPESAAEENKKHVEKALKAVNSGANPLDTYALNYCKTYPTYARAFLSYYNWNKAKTTSVIGKFSELITIIIGTGDKRIEGGWRQQLQDQNSNVVLVEGANHFFDQTYEFDLMDVIENILSTKMER